MWKKIKTLIIELLFPRYCLGCQKEGSYLCPDCQSLLEISGYYQKEEAAGLSDLYFAVNYQKPLIKKLIQKLKYEPFIKELAKTLASFIIEHFQLLDNKPNFSQFILIPVPLEKKKWKWRGFNQAQEIGKELSDFWEIPSVNDVLIKIRETLPQVELSDEERRENVKGAFSIKNEEKIRGKKILLVDDVFTTGATLEECAKVLKKAGAKEIIGLVVARG